MTDGNRDLVMYRISRANDTLDDARILANSSRWNACVNRLCYACISSKWPATGVRSPVDVLYNCVFYADPYKTTG